MHLSFYSPDPPISLSESKPNIMSQNCHIPPLTSLSLSPAHPYISNYEKKTDTVLSVSIDSFRQLDRMIKTKMTVKNPIAYYTGIMNKKFQEIYFGELFELNQS